MSTGIRTINAATHIATVQGTADSFPDLDRLENSHTDPILSTAAASILGLLRGANKHADDGFVDLRTTVTYQFSPLVAALAQSEILGRLNGIRQLGIAETSRGMHGNGGFGLTRYEHSLNVAEIASRIAGERLGFDERTVERVALAALLHDVAHTPFSHSGETALRVLALPGMRYFDHDNHAGNVLQTEEIRNLLASSTLNRHGIKVAEIISDLETPEQFGVGYLVKEIADRLANLRLDFDGTAFKTKVRHTVLEVADAMETSLSATSDGSIYLNHARPEDRHNIMHRMLALWAIVRQEYLYHPQATLKDEVLLNAISKPLKTERLSPAQFITLTDQQALNYMEERDQVRLGRNEAGLKLDDFFKAVAWVQLGDLNPEFALKLENRDCLASFRRHLAEDLGVSVDDFVIGLTPDYSKTVHYLSAMDDGSFERRAVSVSVSPSRRFVFVALSVDVLEKQAAVQAAFNSFLEGQLKEFKDGKTAAVKYTDLLQQNIEARWFPE